MVDAVVVSTYNGVIVEPVPSREVYTDLVQLNRTSAFGNALLRALGMDTRGKEWSTSLQLPNSFAALHANITPDMSRAEWRNRTRSSLWVY